MRKLLQNRIYSDSIFIDAVILFTTTEYLNRRSPSVLPIVSIIVRWAREYLFLC